MSGEKTDHLDVNRTRALRLRRALALTVFLCVAAILITLIVYFAMLRRSASRDLAELQGIRQDLQVIVDRIDWTTNQASADKRVVWNMLRQCRAAEDIPALQSDRVFSDHSNTDRVVMYIPAGDHDLEISASWLPSNTKNPSTTAETKEPGLSGEKLWKIPVTGSGGYLLRLSTEHTGGAIEWELTANHPDFRTQNGAVPLEDFQHSGASWSSKRVGEFPNQISPGWFLWSAEKIPKPGVELFAVKLFGSQLEQDYEVRIDVRLTSHTPPCVTAADAQRLIIMKRSDVLMPYQGFGRYEVRLDP